jgi:hypothetical protein
VPWLRRLAAGLPTRRPEFDPGSVHVGFVVDKVALGQGFPKYCGLPLPISFRWCSITRKMMMMMMMMIIIIIIIISLIIWLHKKP